MADEPACRKAAFVQLPIEDEGGSEVLLRDTGTIRTTSFKGLSQVVQEAFAGAPPQLVLVVAPSGRARRGRFAALADIASLLPPGTCILLGDALRYREGAMLDEWRSRALVQVDGIYCMGTGLAVARVM